MNLELKTISRLAIVAAIYVVLTVSFQPISYGNIQFRISEVLVLLCFYRKDYGYGLIIGCLIANIFSPFGIVDVVFGTLATTLAVIGIMFSKRLFIASLYPVILNGLIIGAQLYFFAELPLIESMIFVAIGEFVVVSIVGVLLFKDLQKHQPFMKLIDANQNYKINEEF